jgi:WD40 repeat protein
VCDEKRIVSGDEAGAIRMFALESGACTDLLFQAPDCVSALLLRGDVLVGGCYDGKVRAWDLSIGSGSLREFEDVEGGGIYNLCWQESVGPMRVVSGGSDGIRVWGVESGRCVLTISIPQYYQTIAADLHRLMYRDEEDGKLIKMLDFSQ